MLLLAEKSALGAGFYVVWENKGFCFGHIKQRCHLDIEQEGQLAELRGQVRLEIQTWRH